MIDDSSGSSFSPRGLIPLSRRFQRKFQVQYHGGAPRLDESDDLTAKSVSRGYDAHRAQLTVKSLRTNRTTKLQPVVDMTIVYLS